MESSFYARDCSDCDFAVVCQQFRCRDLKNCTIRLFTSTEPVIESSSGLRFQCFNLNWASLKTQMPLAKLSPYNNKWSRIFDFTKNDDGTLNYEFVKDEDETVLGNNPRVQRTTPEKIWTVTPSSNFSQVTIPVTVGDRQMVKMKKKYLKVEDAFPRRQLMFCSETDSFELMKAFYEANVVQFDKRQLRLSQLRVIKLSPEQLDMYMDAENDSLVPPQQQKPSLPTVASH